MSDWDFMGDLDKLSTWMRKVGATRAKVDGLELELGPEPIPETPSIHRSAESIAARKRQYQQDLLLGASEGLPLDSPFDE